MPKGVYFRTEETKKSLSKNRLGKIRKTKHPGFSVDTRMKMSLAAKGKSKSEEAKRKMRENYVGNRGMRWTVKDSTKMKGRKPWNYIEDRSILKKSPKKHLDCQYRDWMFAVKKRDNWVCRIADVNCDGRLEAHHILDWINYPELRYDINNGITLCHAHHPRGRAKEKLMSPYFMELLASKE